MYETKDNDWRRPLDPDTAAVLTIGAIGKLASAAAEARATFAKFDDALTDIERQIEQLEKQSADDAAPRAIVR